MQGLPLTLSIGKKCRTYTEGICVWMIKNAEQRSFRRRGTRLKAIAASRRLVNRLGANHIQFRAFCTWTNLPAEIVQMRFPFSWAFNFSCLLPRFEITFFAIYNMTTGNSSLV
jgi:hypothetical protein